MRLLITFVALVLIVSTPIAVAKTCSLTDSINAEKATDNLKSWADIYDAFVRHTPQCDDGGVAEGFSDRIVHLLASNWDALPKLNSLTKKDALFKPFILKHIDATADTNELRLIVKKSNSECMVKYQRLCFQIGKAAAAAVKEAEKYEAAKP
jgi:hypothetical protein